MDSQAKSHFCALERKETPTQIQKIERGEGIK